MAVNEREQLEQAIAALEAQRALLGDAVVDAAIGPMREKLDALTATPRAEQRKLVTILFADLAGWTAMSESMDAEDVRAVQQAYFAAVTAPILERGGRVEKYIGDAVLAVFGIPQAREDDPEQAVRAALAMQQTLATLSVETLHATSLRMRIGVHTGPVLATIGQHVDDFVVTGDAVNVAARLQGEAPPGGVLISHDTWRHVTDLFEVAVQASFALRGRAEPIQTYLVQGAHPRPFRRGLGSVAGVRTRMIGRKTELELLQDALLTVMEDRQAQMMTLIGEAGVGKSRLMIEFEEWVDRLPQEVFWFRGRATQEGQLVPYGLMRDMFARRFQIKEGDALLEVRQKLGDGFLAPLRSAGRGESDLETKDVHVIGQFLGYDFRDSPHVKPMLDEPQHLREQALATMEAYFRALALQYPVTVILEDIHWADNSSLDTLTHLLSRLDHVSLLVVGAGRPNLYQRRPQWGEGLAYHRRLDLQPLSKRQVGQLLDELLQRTDEVPGKLRELVVAGADGNPFFVEELVRMLIEEGAILVGTGDQSVWRIEPERLAGVHVPASLTAILQARVDRLSPEERSTLQQASVVGRLFWDRAVAYIQQSSEGGSEDVTSALSALREREIVFRREVSTFAQSQEYLFKHALLRDVAYEGMLKRLRRVYHGLVADWLATQTGERIGEYTGIIADHLERAGRLAEAVEYLLRAGDQARLLYARQEALGYYERALTLQQAQGERREAARTYMRIGLVYQGSFEAEQAQRAFDEAFALWSKSTEPSRVPSHRTAALPVVRAAIKMPSLLDPGSCFWGEDAALAVHLFSGLVSETIDLLVLPDLAQRWDVLEGGRRYVFHLRQDARWSDGTPVTAHDLEFSWRRNLDPKTISPLASLLDDVRDARAFRKGQLTDPARLGITALDDVTFAIELEGPRAYFLHILAQPVTFPVPRHVVQAGDEWIKSQTSVGNGPFLLHEWHPGERMVWVRNPDFTGDRAGNVERIEMVDWNDAPWQDMLDRYAANDLDVLDVGLYPTGAIDAALRLWPREIITSSLAVTSALTFNLALTPLNDPRVRQAFAMTLDPHVIAAAYHPDRIADGGWVPPGLSGHSPGIALPFNPARARQLLSEAGYPGGQGFPEILLQYRAYDRVKGLCNSMQDMWKRYLGIVVPYEVVAHNTDLSGAHLSVAGYLADYYDPDAFLRSYFRSTPNGWHDPGYERLVEEARCLMDHEARMALYRQADRMLIEQAVLVPFAYLRSHVLVKPWITGLWTRLEEHLGWKDAILAPHAATPKP